MSSCCQTSSSRPRSARCPGNGRYYRWVSSVTVRHQLRAAWQWSPPESLYFCDDPNCQIVYFSADGITINEDALRQPVGQKHPGQEALFCYCFDIKHGDLDNDPAIRKFIMEQTKLGHCACNVRNPSGRCCLQKKPH